jgi:hypothetical protein
MGRKPLTEKYGTELDIVIRHISNGLTHVRACDAAGIKPQSFENALTRGRKEGAPLALRELVEAVDRANHAGIASKVDMIVAHGYDDWRAIAWLLARQDPATYGAVNTLRVGGDPEGVPLKTEQRASIDFSKWEPARIAAYIELVEGSGEVELDDE